MSVTSKTISKDKTVEAYTLTNAKDTMSVTVTTYGARVNNIVVLDRNNKKRDVCIGFDSQEQLLEGLGKSYQYFGATIGRVAGRIWPCHEVTVGNQVCDLTGNRGPDINLHGGLVGWDAKIWDAEIVSQNPPKISMSYVSEDGEQGYCGKVKMTVFFEVTDKNELKLSYEGKLLEGEASLLDSTNHIYFNLSGFEDPTIRNHILKMPAYGTLDCNDALLPQGWINKVDGTPFDFRKPRRIGEQVDVFPKDLARGYDHPFIVDEPKPNDCPARPVKNVGECWCNLSGIKMDVFTDEPSIVFYTGNYIDPETKGKDGITYQNYSGFAFEPQRYCDSIMFPQWKDQFILKRGQTYEQKSVYQFSTYQEDKED